MPKIELPGSMPVVDFDDFHFPDTGFNREIAKDISMIFLSYVNQDDLQWTTEFDENNYWETSIGSGGTGMQMSCMTQSHQRAIISSAFADYATLRYNSLYLGLCEYQALKEILDDLENYAWGYERYPKKYELINKQIQLLKITTIEFEKAYMKHEPGFLFNLIKSESIIDTN